MALDKFQKQPHEKYFIGVNYSKALGSSEAIVLSSTEILATDSNGVDATADVLEDGSAAVDGSVLLIRVMSGLEERAPYKLTFRAHTDQGNIFEKDVNMRIKEL